MPLAGLNLQYGFDLRFDATNHVHLINGVMVPGVTTITDLLPKKALVPWAAKETVESIRKAWTPGKGYFQREIDEILKTAKSAWRTKRDVSADKGTQAHAWIETYIKTGETQDLPQDEQVRNCVYAFLDWEAAHHVEWIASEVQVGSSRHGFGGILDAFARIDGEPSLADFKTSNGIYESHYIQTAGYKIGMVEGGLEDFGHRYILRFPKDGSGFEARLVPTAFLRDQDTFCRLLDLYHALKHYSEFFELKK